MLGRMPVDQEPVHQEPCIKRGAAWALEATCSFQGVPQTGTPFTVLLPPTEKISLVVRSQHFILFQ